MFVKQIDRNQALELFEKGHDIPIMVPDGPNWENYYPTTLSDLLEGCVFFRREVAENNPDFEALFPSMPEPELPQNSPPTAGAAASPSTGTKKPASRCVGTSAKRKSVDMGKLQALRKAGWSMKKIADEMSVSEGTVWNYLKRLEEKNEGNRNG